MARKLSHQRVTYGKFLPLRCLFFVFLHPTISPQSPFSSIAAMQQTKELELHDAYNSVCLFPVLPPPDAPGGHRLGVNGLAIDSANSTL
jgi:hypothetical protein